MHFSLSSMIEVSEWTNRASFYTLRDDNCKDPILKDIEYPGIPDLGIPLPSHGVRFINDIFLRLDYLSVLSFFQRLDLGRVVIYLVFVCLLLFFISYIPFVFYFSVILAILFIIIIIPFLPHLFGFFYWKVREWMSESYVSASLSPAFWCLNMQKLR